ncbi:MAG: T9SS type A sorting domain-containing protein, partial [Rubricoccaceae bacterium]|nr:T9SS type A sorting domain-containing protein [Rubricoccaceae bacterium]
GRLYVGLGVIGTGGGWVWRTAERLTAAVAEVAAPSGGPLSGGALSGGPLTVGPGGGALPLSLSVANTTGRPLSVEAWAEVEGPGVSREVLGPVGVSLDPGASLTRGLRLRVPAGAPAGSYVFRLRVGRYPGTAWPGSVISSDSVAFEKAAFEKEAVAVPPGGAGAGGWSVSGWGGEGARGGGVSGDGAPSLAVRPNPWRGSATVTLTVAAAGAASVAVYDVLGRRVAVVHEGPLGAGRHEWPVEAGLAPGVYVVRVVAGSEAASQAVTVLR